MYRMSAAYGEVPSHDSSASISPTVRVAKEIVFGPTIGCVCIFFGSIIGAGIDKGLSGDGAWSGLGGFVVGASVGYLVGVPLGVYAAAHGSGKDVSYLRTFACSTGGACLSLLLAQTYHPKGAAAVGLAVLPLVASILYVELAD